MSCPLNSYYSYLDGVDTYGQLRSLWPISPSNVGSFELLPSMITMCSLNVLTLIPPL